MLAAAPNITSLFKGERRERVSMHEHFSCISTFHQEARYLSRSLPNDLPLCLIGQRWLPLVPRKVNVCLSNLYSVKQPRERRLTVAFGSNQKSLLQDTDVVANWLVIVVTPSELSFPWDACFQPFHGMLLKTKWMHSSLLVPILFIKKPYYYLFPQAGLLTRRESIGCLAFQNQLLQ